MAIPARAIGDILHVVGAGNIFALNDMLFIDGCVLALGLSFF
jgi:hypothetical protein